MRTAAVVVNWNGGEDNLDCIESLARQDELGRIVFVDNASSDGSCEAVAERFPAIELIRNERNLGYGGGNNAGIAQALRWGAEAVLIVNNDVVLPPGTLARLLAELERDPRVGIVGPRVLYRPDPSRVWAAGGRLTWRQNLTTLLGHGERDGARWRATTDVDYVIGCAMLVRRAVFDRIGLFDPDYFAYTEDVDFGLRAARAGWTSRIVGEVAALHAPSTSTGGGYNPRRKYMMGVNSIWFLRQHGGLWAWTRFLVFDVLSLPLLFVWEVTRGNGPSVLAKARGILDGLRGKRVTAAAAGGG
jgi:GT2 family glycosyltransferase